MGSVRSQRGAGSSEDERDIARALEVAVNQAANRRAGTWESLSAFTKWLAKNPVDNDRAYGGLGVRYQVARYCEYLESNPWPSGDPLRDPEERDRAVEEYARYLETFNMQAATIRLVRASLDHFYVFLGLGAAK